uniref:hypothetical protein n=1 Tax=Pedobacter sp. TaxID=1411316 RepID=UPI00159B661C|nr:hypothetical protein [Pedobacter sp.]QJS06237.1 hypothetical protein [Pedobacter sp.]
MSWSKFIMILVAVYSCYYVFNIVFDVLLSKRSGAVTSGSDELTFSEDVMTMEVEENQYSKPVPPPKPEPAPVSVNQVVPEEESPETIWEREEEDTEEINIVSTNINESTGGVTDMSTLIKMAKSNTIHHKRKVVYT